MLRGFVSFVIFSPAVAGTDPCLTGRQAAEWRDVSMKTKKLSDYLDLMKEARDRGKYLEVKRLGEAALKKLPGLAASPKEKYLLYHRLGYIYGFIYQYSAGMDALHKAYTIANKYRLGPEYLASVSYLLAFNFLSLKNFNLALRQYRLVEAYYQKYGYKKPPMDWGAYLYCLEGQAYCHLSLNNPEKTREIIEEKLQVYESSFNTEQSGEYYHLQGEYRMAVKDYARARLAFQESVRICRQEHGNAFFEMGLSAKIHLATLDILDGQPGSVITLLKTILKEAGRLKHNEAILCETLLLLSKSYELIGSNNKAAILEKRLRTILKKIDVVWFYGISKEIDQIYRQLEAKEEAEKSGASLVPIPAGVVTRTREYLNGQFSSYHPDAGANQYALVGQSDALKEVYQLIEKVAPTNLPVLIYGETGTGKELVARAIHQRSLRSRQTWLACNTGAIPETLLESELFGYVKGAFTGAQSDKKGYIELASNGTLFLDEIGSMSLGMQQKLLRVMEDNQLWRVGAETPVLANTRFVLASNEDLEELVKQKRFREDLYYRINTIIITLPPLRERKEDISLLVDYFIKKYAGKRSSFSIPDSTFSILINYPWPGNIRELENEIKRICVLHPGLTSLTEPIFSETIRNYQKVILEPASEYGTLKELTDTFQKDIIIKTILKCNGNITQASILLGYARPHLYEKMKQLGINLPVIKT